RLDLPVRRVQPRRCREGHPSPQGRTSRGRLPGRRPVAQQPQPARHRRPYGCGHGCLSDVDRAWQGAIAHGVHADPRHRPRDPVSGQGAGFPRLSAPGGGEPGGVPRRALRPRLDRIGPVLLIAMAPQEGGRSRVTTVITYGTFDLFHIGHVNLLRRLRALGDRLVVGCSTDEFNALKGKKTVMPYEHRAQILAALRYVDAVFPEANWEQKRDDILRERADIFAMGEDWAGRFDDL